MSDRVLCTFYTDKPEFYVAITKTHETDPHPFRIYTPSDHGRAVICVLPNEDRTTPMRASRALKKLFGVGIPFLAEIRGLDHVSSLAEFQFWGLTDWVAGYVGTDKPEEHFLKKGWEEYIEAQDDISDQAEGQVDEFVDLLFCVAGYASNRRINLSDGFNNAINTVLSESDQIKDAQPVSFYDIDGITANHPDIALDFTKSDQASGAFYDQIPESYFQPMKGMKQESQVEQIRLYRTLLSSAHQAFTSAVLEGSDYEINDGESGYESDGYLAQNINRAAVIILLTASHIATKQGISLEDYINRNVAKINARIASKQPVTRIN